MATNSTMPTPSSTEGEQFLCDDWFDPLENGVRTRIRGFIEELLEAELDAALGRARYERPGAGGGDSPESFAGSRHGHRKRRILGTFGATTVRVPRDKKATSISRLVALGVRADGQKVLLAIKNMGGESEAAWRALLDNLVSRGLKTPELVIVDGGSGLDKALAALWPDVPVQRCTGPKHRNLLAQAPGWRDDDGFAEQHDMVYAL